MHFNETHFAERIQSFGSRHFAHMYFIVKMQSLFLWQRHEAAWKVAQTSERFSSDSIGMRHQAEHVFYRALIACARMRQGCSGQMRLSRVARKASRQLVKWAKHCPQNFSCRSLLLSAEIARSHHRVKEATEGYARALAAAQAASEIHLEATCALLAAGHASDLSQWDEAKRLRTLAAARFDAWGADALAEEVRKESQVLQVTSN